MKKIVFLMCMVFIAIPAFAQIGIIWQVDEGYLNQYLGSANMDDDPNEELVYFDSSYRIVILDGVSGLIEWDSGDWYLIRIAGYNTGYGNNYGFSPFCDGNNDGIKEITFGGMQNSGDPYQEFLVGITGTGIDDEPYNSNANTRPLLSQNYPNPFNPNTTIEYQLKKAGYIELKIYNVKGQLVDTLVKDNQNTGNYSVIWDAKGISSGVYFYQISVDGKATETKKAINLK